MFHHLEVFDMIASNMQHFFGTKIARIETLAFRCEITTSKEGMLKKQSTVVSELSKNNTSRKAARFVFNENLSSEQRLFVHDSIVSTLDTLGSKGTPLKEALQQVFTQLTKEGTAIGSFL